MPQPKIPDIDFQFFVLGKIKDLFDTNKIYINPTYQRGDIWTHTQQTKLIESIENRYSIGVLVLFINDNGQFEILDGQQRLLAIKKYLEGNLDLNDTDLTPYRDLDETEKILTDAYCIYYLKLKSHDPESKEEDIMQTFLRLQEGSPLNKAEKISAHRGLFKNEFKKAAEESELFKLMNGDKRFRFRLLAAEMLLLELEGDYKNKLFPSLELKSFIDAIGKYKNKLPPAKVKFYKGNLDILHQSLNYLLTALTPREILTFYLLVSYLRKIKARNQNLINEISAFAKEFLKNLNSFGIYDEKGPVGLAEEIFKKYRTYKFEAKVMTTPESIRKRFDIVLEEYKRLKPFIEKDPKRYFEEEQKRILYFRQQGLCSYCGNPLDFRTSSGDHVVPHGSGGDTSDLTRAQLLHDKCHKKIEKSRKAHLLNYQNLTFIKYIVRRSTELKNQFTYATGAPVEFACIFCQSEEEYQSFTNEIEPLGKIVEDTNSEYTYLLDKPIDTASGPLRLVKIRKPDPLRPERGDADFNTDYAVFKRKYQNNPRFELIRRENFEMLRLSDKNFNVLACFSNIPKSRDLRIKL